MTRSPRTATTWLLVVLLVISLAPASGATPVAPTPGPDLGPGWSVGSGPAGPVLVYTPDETLPLRSARPEFRDGDALLGYPLLRGERLELALTPAALAALESPGAWLSGRRLDGPTPGETFATQPPEVSISLRALTGSKDPGTPGPYATATFSYDLPGLALDDYPVPIEVLGEVIAPVGAPEPMPLVLFLHGRHSTCYFPGPESFVTGDWPCPDGALPIPSHQGYRYAAELLASQGYLTVSISANGINAQDGWVPDGGAAARSALIRHHLSLWAGWNTGGDPWGGIFQGAVALGKVILVGHSRGGEGVERAAIDATADDPYTIIGLVPIGPTSFGRQVGAGIATAVILPYCDGDVVDLQGQTYIDDSRDLIPDRALRSAVLAMGTNHNFYNTEWTPGLAAAPSDDDWLWAGAADDPACGPDGPGRLTPEEQQAVGATYIAALARVAVHRDADAASLLDGSRVRAASAGRASVLTHALGGRRHLIYRPRLSDLITTAGLSARACRGYMPSGSWGLQSECAPIGFDRLPHWLPMMGAETAPSPLALDLQWWRMGGTARVALRGERDLSKARALDVRLAVDTTSPAVDLRLRLVDRRGSVVELPAGRRLAALPGDQSPLGKIWAQTLRFDLEFDRLGIDLSAITALELVSRTGRGHAWLLDVSAYRPGTTPSSPRALPQVSVATVEIPEGGPGARQEYLPLEIRGDITQAAVIWVTLYGPAGQQSYRMVLPPGTTEAAIPVTVAGNDEYNPWPLEYSAAIKAISRVTTGEYIGALRLVEDEPAPVLTFAATRGRVAEGGTLVFTASLSAPLATDLWYSVTLGEVPGRPTLYSDDVPQDFLWQWAGWVPDPPVPLWQAVSASIYFPPFATTATFEIPTVADGVVEGREYVDVTLSGWGDPLLPVPITVRGVVRDG